MSNTNVIIARVVLVATETELGFLGYDSKSKQHVLLNSPLDARVVAHKDDEHDIALGLDFASELYGDDCRVKGVRVALPAIHKNVVLS